MSSNGPPKPTMAGTFSGNPVMAPSAASRTSQGAASPAGSSQPNSRPGPKAVPNDDEAEEGEITEEGEIVEEKPTSPPSADQPKASTSQGSPTGSTPSVQVGAVVDPPARKPTSSTTADSLPVIANTDAAKKAEGFAVPSSDSAAEEQQRKEQPGPISPTDNAPAPAIAKDPSSSLAVEKPEGQVPPAQHGAVSAPATTETSASIAAATTATTPEIDVSSIKPVPAAFVGTTNADAPAEVNPLHPPNAHAVAPLQTTEAEIAKDDAIPSEKETPRIDDEGQRVVPSSESASSALPAAGVRPEFIATPAAERQASREAMAEGSEPLANGPGKVETEANLPQSSSDSNRKDQAPGTGPDQIADIEMEDVAQAPAASSPTAVNPEQSPAEANAALGDSLDEVQTPAPASDHAEPPQNAGEEESKPVVSSDNGTSSVAEPANGAQRSDAKDLTTSDGSIRTPEAVAASIPSAKPVEEGVLEPAATAVSDVHETKVVAKPSVEASDPANPHEPSAERTVEREPNVGQTNGDSANAPQTSTASAAVTPERKMPASEPNPGRPSAEPAALEPRGVPQAQQGSLGQQAPLQPQLRSQPHPPPHPQAQPHSQPQPQAHQQQQLQQQPQQQQQQRPRQQQQQGTPDESMRQAHGQATDLEPLSRERKSRSNTARPSTSEIDRANGFERHAERERPSNRERRREQESDRDRVARERERERERLRESERDRELMIARENEEARLIWLSLPGNDHPQYYTDTDSDSCYDNGGAGMYGTDEEDKDLDPPMPLTLQEFHAPPSTASYLATASSKRKSSSYPDVDPRDRTGREMVPGRGRASAAKRRAYASAISPDYDGSIPALPFDAQTRGMISIDDFPVPDSSIRGEPEHRPLFNHDANFGLYEVDDDDYSLVTSDSEEEASRIAAERKRRHGNRVGNRGNKLSRAKGVRWHRRSKLGGWTEARMEKEIGDRVRHRIESLQKDSIRALVAAMPVEDKEMLHQFPALRDGLLPAEAHLNGLVLRDGRGRLLPSDLSEAARLDVQLGLGAASGHTDDRSPFSEGSEHLTSTSLAPTLLKPAVTARQLLTSHTLRHTFRNPHIGALGKTALDLIESEGVLGRAIGRCWASMERGGWNVEPEPRVNVDDEDMDVEELEANGHDDADANSDEDRSEMLGSLGLNPALQHLDHLFVTKGGLAIPKLDEAGQPVFEQDSALDPSSAAPEGGGQPTEPRLATTLLPAMEQRAVVLAALECLHDLAADSREYVERLEEVRSRLAAIKRRRAEVWAAVREWAIEKEENGEGEKTFDPATSVTAAAAAAATTAAGSAGLANPSSSLSLSESDGAAIGADAGAASSANGVTTPSGKPAKSTSSATGKGRKKAKASTSSSTATTAAPPPSSTSTAAAEKPTAPAPAPAPSGRNTVTSALAGVAYSAPTQ